MALTRKASFGSMRPCLHQYEVKGRGSGGPNSAPSSPVKTKDSGFRRSLSFGGPGMGRKAPPPPLPPPPPHPPRQAPVTTPTLPSKPSTPKEEGVVTPCSATPTNPTMTSSGGKCVVARQCESFYSKTSGRAPSVMRTTPVQRTTNDPSFLCLPVSPEQVDYMQEVKAFEAELQRHSHKFPHDILFCKEMALNIRRIVVEL